MKRKKSGTITMRKKIAINERKIIPPIHFQNSGPGPENA